MNEWLTTAITSSWNSRVGVTGLFPNCNLIVHRPDMLFQTFPTWWYITHINVSSWAWLIFTAKFTECQITKFIYMFDVWWNIDCTHQCIYFIDQFRWQMSWTTNLARVTSNVFIFLWTLRGFNFPIPLKQFVESHPVNACNDNNASVGSSLMSAAISDTLILVSPFQIQKYLFTHHLPCGA